MNQSSRAECLVAVAREFGANHDECLPVHVPLDRFLLVQRNLGGAGPSFWLTTHASPFLAGNYIAAQEFPEDWRTEVLLDLDTGARMTEGAHIILWEPVPVTATGAAK
jgi:hypothetical protein